MRLPLTGSLLYDFTLVIIVLIAGVGLATKADMNWGWVLAVLALFWAFQLLRPFMGI